MKKSFIVHAGLTALLLGTAMLNATATPTTVTLTPVADGSLFSDNGASASGTADMVFSGITLSSTYRRIVTRFDLSAIPANALVQSATLTLFVTKSVHAGEESVSLHRLTADWGEGTTNNSSGAGGPATPDSVTWTHRHWSAAPCAGNACWTTPGGDFVASASAVSAVGDGGPLPTPYTWASTTLNSDVQQWIQTPSANFGWIVIAEAVSPSAKRYTSREFATVAQRPSLSVTYDLPAAPTAKSVPIPFGALVALGGAIVIAARNTRARRR